MSNHKFKPQCKTRADLHREMARVLDMCKDFPRTGGYPLSLSCVRYNGSIPPHHDGLPHLYMEPDKYEFAIAIVEGKPVFRGDVLYYRKDGEPCTVELAPGGDNRLGFVPVNHSEWGYCSEHPSDLTWNPPQRTIEINGVKVKAADEIKTTSAKLGNGERRECLILQFASGSDAEAFKAAMEG